MMAEYCSKSLRSKYQFTWRRTEEQGALKYFGTTLVAHYKLSDMQYYLS